MLFLSLIVCFYCKFMALSHKVLLSFEQFVVNPTTQQQQQAGRGIHKAATKLKDRLNYFGRIPLINISH